MKNTKLTFELPVTASEWRKKLHKLEVLEMHQRTFARTIRATRKWFIENGHSNILDEYDNTKEQVR